MPAFSERSLAHLNSCDPRLQALFTQVIKIVDCTILCGHRNEEDQNRVFLRGMSKLMFPKSKHNTLPSKAVDVVAYPIAWNDRERLYLFVGVVKGVASMMDIPIRSGLDWDNDFDVKDQSFFDGPHFELIEEVKSEN